MNPHNFQFYALAFSAGYILYDLFVCLFLIKGVSSPLMRETLIHHYFVLFGSLAAIYSGHMMTTLGAASYLTEISTPFVNYRAFMITHEKGTGKVYTLNNMTFAALFFVFRVCFYPPIIWRLIYALVSYREILSVNSIRWVVTLALTVMYLALYVL